MFNSLVRVAAASTIVMFVWPWGAVADPPAAPFECRRTTSSITIDGRADEPCWQLAQRIDRFVTPWLPDQPPAKTATVARLLWDDAALYFHAEMVDHDLFADKTEHDSNTWENDVFELFFRPSTDKRNYYEFQINPAGTRFDMLMRHEAKLDRFEDYRRRDKFNWTAQAVVRGTLDVRTDDDQGWSVEGRFPWSDFAHTGGRPAVGDLWTCALCRYDYDQRWQRPNLSTIAPLTQVNFHQIEKYAPLKFVGVVAQ